MAVTPMETRVTSAPGEGGATRTKTNFAYMDGATGSASGRFFSLQSG